MKIGEVVNYANLALSSGLKSAFRAVGNAVAKNFAILVPCHRVIKSSGELGNFQWGENRKKDIIQWESSQMTAQSN